MYAYAYANAMQLWTKHLRCYRASCGPAPSAPGACAVLAHLAVVACSPSARALLQ
jgi:hypothetical protein